MAGKKIPGNSGDGNTATKKAGSAKAKAVKKTGAPPAKTTAKGGGKKSGK